jgi:hypothetical protein
MIAQMELDIQRQLTKSFIAADVTNLVLVRQTKVPNGSGGYSTTEVSLAAQAVRLIPQQDVTREVQTPDGSMVKPRYVLLGMHTLNVARWDKFTWQDSRYQVADVEPKQYETKGDVIYLGRV